MKRLFLCENGAAAQKIADFFGENKATGTYFSNEHDIFYPCPGHLLRLDKPVEINTKYKIFNRKYLPIIPDRWLHRPLSKPELKEELTKIHELLKEADEIVIAGSPSDDFHGRCNNIINYYNIAKPLRTIYLTGYDVYSLNALNAEPQLPFRAEAYLAKERLDWLFGVNASCSLSLSAGKPISISRLKMPILNMVYKRNAEIKNHNAVTEYTLTVYFWQHKGLPIPALWITDKPVTDITVVRNIKNKVSDAKAKVESINDITIENPAPQPFTMAELMMYAAHKLKIPLQRIEKTIWDLYYNGYISIYSNPTILKTKYLKNILENLMVAGDDNILRLAKKALLSWAADSDKNISGIIPTMQRVDFVELKQDQGIILKMLSRRFLLGFYASNKYIERTINISCAGELFGYKQIQTIQQGWKLNNIGNDTIFKEVLPEEELFPKGPLSIQEKVKAAPKAYTLATLYSALCNANLLAENRKLHYYNFGIGTDYNRLTIINDLIHDGYLKFKNNTLSLADSLNDIWPYLPEELLNTDYTVYCEYTLEQVRKGEITANEYIKQRVPYIKKLATQQLKPGYQIQHKLCPVCSKGYLVLKSSKQDKFWGCTNFPECKASFANINSEPFIMACPECKTGYLKKRSKINEVFWCCSNYPACTYMASKLPNKKEE